MVTPRYVTAILARMPKPAPLADSLVATLSEEQFQREIRAAELQITQGQARLSWARMGLQLRREAEAATNGHKEPDPLMGGVRPTLRKAILMVMHEHPRRVWKKSEIFGKLKEREWAPQGTKPSSQVATRLAEMIDRGEVERVSVGHYRLTRGQAG